MNRCVSVKRHGLLSRYGLLRVNWAMRCEELVGLGVKRVGPLLRYGLLRVKWTISVREVRSTFEVEFIKGEVDRQCEGLSV